MRHISVLKWVRMEPETTSHTEHQHALTRWIKPSGVWKKSLDLSNRSPVRLRPSQNTPSPSACNVSYIRSTQLLDSWISKYFPRIKPTLDRGNLPSKSSTDVEMPSNNVKGIRSSHELKTVSRQNDKPRHWLTLTRTKGLSTTPGQKPRCLEELQPVL